MRVMILATAKTESVNDSYALRLYEQGRAVIVKTPVKNKTTAAPAEPKKSEDEKPAEE